MQQLKQHLKTYFGYPVWVTECNPDGERLIVLLHGFGASSLSWNEVMADLAGLGHVLAYDRPGYGFTPLVERSNPDPYSLAGQVELLVQIIRSEANGRPVIVVGHSAGALVAAKCTLEHLGLATKLILESPAIWRQPPVPRWLGARLRNPRLERFADRLLGSFDKTGLTILRKSFFDQAKLTQQVIDRYQSPMQNPHWRLKLWRAMTADQSNSVREQLGRLALPVFVVSGEADQITKVEDTFRVAERIPGHRIYLVPNAGHLAHEEQPDDWLRVVADFIRA